MQKTFEGKIVSVKMQNTALVEIVRKSPHPVYKKLLKRSRKFKADTAGISLNIGDMVRIVETKPISKDKKFKVMEVLK
ncbi:30S ribosomal protein S17 [Patescibacteria group bacterium]|nr:30S ribosomal protein S17 [Patescibacteria group bacterium]